MTPLARMTISLSLTLVMWSPTLAAELRSDSPDLAGAASKFIILFVVTRLAMRWIDWLVRRYAPSAPAPSGPPPSRQSTLAMPMGRFTDDEGEDLQTAARRRTDPQVLEQPQLKP